MAWGGGPSQVRGGRADRQERKQWNSTKPACLSASSCAGVTPHAATLCPITLTYLPVLDLQSPP